MIELEYLIAAREVRGESLARQLGSRCEVCVLPAWCFYELARDGCGAIRAQGKECNLHGLCRQAGCSSQWLTSIPVENRSFGSSIKAIENRQSQVRLLAAKQIDSSAKCSVSMISLREEGLILSPKHIVAANRLREAR
jgi:hypothetical protein